MKLKILSINRKGRTHRRLEDAIYLNNDDMVYGVFDGVSNSSAGAEAAQGLAKDMGAFLHNREARNLCATLPVQEVRELITQVIQRSAKRVAEETPCELSDLACTMVVCIIDPERNIATILHCGDGAVYGLSETFQDNTTSILSHPDNAASGGVYAAQSAQQIVRMRVVRVPLDTYSRILLCTDGFSDAYQEPFTGRFDSFNLQDVFVCETDEQLAELTQAYHIKKENIGDDISAILICIDNGIEYRQIIDNLRSTPKQVSMTESPSFIKNNEEDKTMIEFPETSNTPEPLEDTPFVITNQAGDEPLISGAETDVDNTEQNGYEQRMESRYQRGGRSSNTIERILMGLIAVIAILSLLFSYRCLTKYGDELKKQQESISVMQSEIAELASERPSDSANSDNTADESENAQSTENAQEPDSGNATDNSSDESADENQDAADSEDNN